MLRFSYLPSSTLSRLRAAQLLLAVVSIAFLNLQSQSPLLYRLRCGPACYALGGTFTSLRSLISAPRILAFWPAPTPPFATTIIRIQALPRPLVRLGKLADLDLFLLLCWYGINVESQSLCLNGMTLKMRSFEPIVSSVKTSSIVPYSCKMQS